MAAAISAFTEGAPVWAVLKLPTEGGAVAEPATFERGVTVVTVLSSLSSSRGSNALYILCCVEYPFWPAVLLNASALRRRVYATWMNFLSSGYVLRGVASHVSKSFVGRRLAPIRMRTALRMICSIENGTLPIT
jgi:hypothetical protein